jgi:hypothetical protein
LLLHHKRMPGNDDEYGAQVWLGYTYAWNAEQTDAVLLDAAGEDRTYTIQDAAAPGGARQQTWHFPSRSECALCHTMAAKYALGVNTLQLNRDFDHGDGHPANQLEKLSKWGVFTQPLPAPPAELPHLARPEDRKAPLKTGPGPTSTRIVHTAIGCGAAVWRTSRCLLTCRSRRPASSIRP